ncbi:phosphatidic acid phosphatase type 2/haloperoxidase [Irpex lacteus]|nr:phosphatidic acid phosphatase type 2/haloperoxidase [Irpex lacteus]
MARFAIPKLDIEIENWRFLMVSIEIMLKFIEATEFNFRSLNTSAYPAVKMGFPHKLAWSLVSRPPSAIDFDICTADRDTYKFNDGWRSFPSGHSSLSFAGLGFLSFYLAGKLHLFDRQAYTFKVWLSITPLIGATLVAVSRTMDYRHHWQDVLTGSILGLVLSYLAYRQYYPPLHSHDCHQPYPPRVRFDEPILPIHRDGDDRSSVEMYGHTDNGYSNSPYHDTSDEEERVALTASRSGPGQGAVDLGTKAALVESRTSQ